MNRALQVHVAESIVVDDVPTGQDSHDKLLELIYFPGGQGPPK